MESVAAFVGVDHVSDSLMQSFQIFSGSKVGARKEARGDVCVARDVAQGACGEMPRRGADGGDCFRMVGVGTFDGEGGGLGDRDAEGIEFLYMGPDKGAVFSC